MNAKMTILLPILAAVSFVAPAEAGQARRFALLIANNEGGPGTEELQYASADAKKMGSVLRELGGFRPEDVVMISEASAIDAERKIAELEDRVRSAKSGGVTRTTLLVYYSGHARGGDLWLGRTRLPMSTLRTRLGESSADIRIGIIDSCEAGAITREKGGRRGPSFLFDVDDREAARGMILISSSSENESSQESDEIGGSFFTHYLASGLRGDADDSGDLRVTLGEVYAYAYNKTVNITASTRSGTQHPTYDYDLKGQGDIVLSDVSRGTSAVLLGKGLVGEFMIFDSGREQVAAEITKKAGLERRIALPPGDYVIKKRLQDHLRMARFTLQTPQTYEVNEAAMEVVDFEDDYAKGAVMRARINRKRTRVGFGTVMLYQSFLAESARTSLVPPIFLFGLQVGVERILGARLLFETLIGGTSEASLQIQTLDIAYNYFQFELAAALLWQGDVGPFAFYAGPRLSGFYMSRSFPNDEVLQDTRQDHFSLSPAASVGAFWYPGRGRNFYVEAIGRLGLLAFGVDENRSLLLGQVGISLGYRL